jgi:hypothetical protein
MPEGVDLSQGSRQSSLSFGERAGVRGNEATESHGGPGKFHAAPKSCDESGVLRLGNPPAEKHSRGFLLVRNLPEPFCVLFIL